MSPFFLIDLAYADLPRRAFGPFEMKADAWEAARKLSGGRGTGRLKDDATVEELQAARWRVVKAEDPWTAQKIAQE